MAGARHSEGEGALLLKSLRRSCAAIAVPLPEYAQGCV